MGAWNGWYHVDGHTYGTWMPGDARGWRERNHRRHVEGDYRNPPPPGTGDVIHNRSEGLLKRPPVYLTPTQRKVGGQAMVEMLLHDGIELLALSLDAVHFHILARFRGWEIRARVGRAKKHAYFLLRDRGHAGEVWTKLTKVTPIHDRDHQINTFNYVCDHGKKGAWVWTFRDGLDWTPDIPGFQQPH